MPSVQATVLANTGSGLDRAPLAAFLKDIPIAKTGSGTTSAVHSIAELFQVEPGGDDLLWAGPTHECLCGNSVFHVLAWFSDYEIHGYMTEAVCAFCGSSLRVPTPLDREEATS